MEEPCPNATGLKISTMTIMTSIKNNVEIDSGIIIDLDIFSRFIPIYPSSHKVIQDKKGGLTGISHSSIYPRGVVNTKKYDSYKKSPFSNQTTLVYEYWGCRYVNIMMFRNGKFKMAGTLSEDEARKITNILIEMIKSIEFTIFKNEETLKKSDYHEAHEYAIVYDMIDQPKYYVWNVFRNFEHYELIMGLPDIHLWSTNAGWMSCDEILKFIEYLKKVILEKETFYNEMKERFNYILLHSKNNTEPNQQTTTSSEIEILENNKNILAGIIINLKYSLKWIEMVYKTDNDILASVIIDKSKKFCSEYDLVFNELQTELINSDFKANFIINNTKLQQILNKKYHIFPSYEPNDYPGLKIGFYSNPLQTAEQCKIGRCCCEVSCISKGKKATCVKLTISIFQSGSVIITAAKSIAQLKLAFDFITNVFKTEYINIRRGTSSNQATLSKMYDNPSNEIRKVLKKMKVYYFKPEDIINYPAGKN
jgi:TATA-box binding protein (TBP) (component of TFIID and TFIIIB)